MSSADHLRDAVAHHRAGRYGEAAASWRAALARRPGDPALLKALGAALQEAGRFEEAAAAFAKALARAPDDGGARILLGNALLGLGRAEAAADELRLALAAAPEAAGAWRGLARAELAAGRPAEAATAYRRLLGLAPDEAASWCEYGVAQMRAGDGGAARAAFARSLALDPHDAAGAGQHLARLDGGALDAGYVARHFDAFAGDFERKLVDVLKYDAPDRLRDLVAPLLPQGRARRMIDLGCGTGLCADAFRDLAAEIDGIDLAPRMVEAARGRGLYRRLVVGDACEALAGLEPGYDLAVAGDVLIYVGDPGPLLAALRRALAPGGLFAFTVELGDEGCALADTLRYRHAPDYVDARLRAHGFASVAWADAPLRLEAGQPVAGRLLAARLENGV